MFSLDQWTDNFHRLGKRNVMNRLLAEKRTLEEIREEVSVGRKRWGQEH